MKLFIKFLLLIIILAIATPFFLKDPDGKALLNIDKIKVPALPTLTDIKAESKQLFNDNTKSASDNVKVFKWVDEKGITHYSDQNNDGFGSKLVEIKPINLLPAHKSEIPEVSETPDLPFSATTIPLEDVSKLLDDTKQVKKLMENRENQIEKALN